jgi:hypothetical protein
MGTFRILVFLSAIAVAASSSAATIAASFRIVPARVAVDARHVEGGCHRRRDVVETDASGRYTFNVSGTGSYLVIVTRNGFSEAARTVVIEQPDHTVDLPVTLELGVMNDQVTVTSNRSEREVRQIPLHVETISRAGIEQSNTMSTGDALAGVANINAVGNGPFIRPSPAARPRFDADAGARRR